MLMIEKTLFAILRFSERYFIQGLCPQTGGRLTTSSGEVSKSREFSNCSKIWQAPVKLQSDANIIKSNPVVPILHEIMR